MKKLYYNNSLPADIEKFDSDYRAHLQLTHEKMGNTCRRKTLYRHKVVAHKEGAPYFYKMFALPFALAEELQAALATPAMQDVGADAHRISTGGPPVIMIEAKIRDGHILNN